MITIVPPVVERLRLTIPAREALEREGNTITRTGSTSLGCPLYSVTLRRPPRNLMLCLIGHGEDQCQGLRCSGEPPYPDEWERGGIAWWDRGQWIGCPQCGAALVWHEAGYVPGYRICLRGHHSQLSSDGRKARANCRTGVFGVEVSHGR